MNSPAPSITPFWCAHGVPADAAPATRPAATTRTGRHRARSLLVEIVVAPESGTARDRIIRATNSRTQLPVGALRATESVQKDIEESLGQAGGYYYERRASYYRNPASLDRVASMAGLAREFTAFVPREPHTARR
ncbi:AIPR family protein [Streptomyces sp. NPDC097107]|uniref:AIPR family protein n=1 Tax=Streptomyces sp. NPDC097107 TaxID=3366089 RepID=UPI00382E7FB0